MYVLYITYMLSILYISSYMCIVWNLEKSKWNIVKLVSMQVSLPEVS